MQLPQSVWSRRLESEYSEMQQSGLTFTVSPDKSEYLIEFKARGYTYSGGMVSPAYYHKVKVCLNRSFPYPGGVEVAWISPIFHPNIRSQDGKVCIHLLNNWSGLTSVAGIAAGLVHLVENPNTMDALDKKAAQYFAANFVGNAPANNKPKIVSGIG